MESMCFAKGKRMTLLHLCLRKESEINFVLCSQLSATILLSRLVYNDSLLDSFSYSCAISMYGKDKHRQHALRLLLEISACICYLTTAATIWLNSDNGSIHSDKLHSVE